MGILALIKIKIQEFLSDLRRHRGLVFIIIIIWVMLLVGICFLKVYIGPLTPDPGFVSFLQGLGFSSYLISALTGIVQVAIAAIYVVIWLYLWHRLVRMYFWRTIDKYNPSNEDNSEAVE